MQTGNTEHKILYWLVMSLTGFHSDTIERLAALEDALQPKPAELPADEWAAKNQPAYRISFRPGHHGGAAANPTADTQPRLVDLIDQAYVDGKGPYAAIHAVADWLEQRRYV